MLLNLPFDNNMSSIEDRDTTPVYLEKITIEGAGPYASKHIDSLINELTATPSKTLHDLTHQTNNIVSELNYLGCFTNVTASYDINHNSKITFDEFGEPSISVLGKINVEALKPTNIGFKTIHNSFGHALAASYINRNFLGNASTLQANAITDLNGNSSTIDVFFSTPAFSPSLKVFTSFGLSKQLTTPYQCSKSANMLQLGVLKEKICKRSGTFTALSTGLNVSTRSLHNVADSADDEIKIYAGTHFKESLFLNMTSTNMQYLIKSNCSLPTHGFTFSLNNELTGLPDSSKLENTDFTKDQFYKLGLDLDLAKSLFNKSITFLSSVKFGSIVNLHGNEGTVHLDDKYYPLISGYEKPIIPSHSVAAGSFLSYNFGVNTKIGPHKNEQPLRLFANINGAASANELTGFQCDQLKTFNKSWKHGLEYGLLYNNGENSAKVFWSKPIDASSDNSIGKFGFEVDVNGVW